MYQLISAIAKPFGGDGHWVNVEIGNMPMHALYSSYFKVWAVLSNVFLTAPVALDLELIRAQHGGKTITFNQLLESLGNQALPTITKVPKIAPRYAKYQDMHRARYKIQPVHPSAAVDAIVNDEDKTWLHVTRPELDYDLFYKHCLVNVNGYYHLTDASDKAIYVVDGMKSCRISRENQIGFVSFASIGGLRTISIRKDMLYKQLETQSYKDTAYINIGEDVGNKTVMLVLGGYLHVLDNKTFHRVGATSYKVDFSNMPFLERYFESKRYIDLSSLGLSKSSRNPDQVSIKELFSDKALEAYLTLSQSFFVVLDHEDIFAEYEPIPKSRIPQMFVSDEVPVYPLISGVGRTLNYWTKFDAGKWLLYATDHFRDRPLYRTVDAGKITSATNQREPADPVYYADAFFLKIGTDLN